MTTRMVDDIGLEPMTFRTSSASVKQSKQLSATGGIYALFHTENRFLHNMHTWVSVPGGCLDVRMTQELLHDSHICASIKGEGCKGMSATVG